MLRPSLPAYKHAHIRTSADAYMCMTSVPLAARSDPPDGRFIKSRQVARGYSQAAARDSGEYQNVSDESIYIGDGQEKPTTNSSRTKDLLIELEQVIKVPLDTQASIRNCKSKFEFNL